MRLKTPLRVTRILRWADAHHARTGKWPKTNSGAVKESPRKTWGEIDRALRTGRHGLPAGGSLPRLLQKRRGARKGFNRLPLPIGQILQWADAHHARTGQWPSATSGRVKDCPRQMWSAVDQALRVGSRGLPAKGSLAKLLQKHRGLRKWSHRDVLTIGQILKWADAHRARTGKWPVTKSGPVKGCPGQTWSALHQALRNGSRGLPGGGSLAKLLQKHRGKTIAAFQRSRRPSRTPIVKD